MSNSRVAQAVAPTTVITQSKLYHHHPIQPHHTLPHPIQSIKLTEGWEECDVVGWGWMMDGLVCILPCQTPLQQYHISNSRSSVFALQQTTNGRHFIHVFTHNCRRKEPQRMDNITDTKHKYRPTISDNAGEVGE